MILTQQAQWQYSKAECLIAHVHLALDGANSTCLKVGDACWGVLLHNMSLGLLGLES